MQLKVLFLEIFVFHRATVVSSIFVFFSGKDWNWFPSVTPAKSSMLSKLKLAPSKTTRKQQRDKLAQSSSGSQGLEVLREALSTRFITHTNLAYVPSLMMF